MYRLQPQDLVNLGRAAGHPASAGVPPQLPVPQVSHRAIGHATQVRRPGYAHQRDVTGDADLLEDRNGRLERVFALAARTASASPAGSAAIGCMAANPVSTPITARTAMFFVIRALLIRKTSTVTAPRFIILADRKCCATLPTSRFASAR